MIPASLSGRNICLDASSRAQQKWAVLLNHSKAFSAT